MNAGDRARGVAADAVIHPTAEIEEGAAVEARARIWHQAQVRRGAVVGAGCIVGKGVYIGAGVSLGANCKIQNYACLYEGVRLEDGVFVGPAVVFTNDRYPRAVNPDGSLKSDADWEVGRTLVKPGAAVGARAVILPGLTLGEWSLVAAGSVVVADVPAHGLVRGNPARIVGWVCSCARPLAPDLACRPCRRQFGVEEGGLHEVGTVPASGSGS